MDIKAPRGTKDISIRESYKWQYVEKKVRELTALYHYQEIRTPIFEHTELFARGVGDTTDVVQKEMYTFLDKGERSITLRPEGTAGALVEVGFYDHDEDLRYMATHGPGMADALAEALLTHLNG